MPDWFRQAADERNKADQQRTLRTSALRPHGRVLLDDGHAYLNLTSNDYLGLAGSPTAPSGPNWGAGSAALIDGYHPLSQELERLLADIYCAEAALLFGSGYLANIGTIPALIGRGDTVISDRLVHASILDGIALSRATHLRFRHRDTQHLEQRLTQATGRTLVVVESLFSMDGDVAPLPTIAALCQRHDALLLVDEAHAVGALGPDGRGLCALLGIQPDILVGTLGKAYGTYGAFVVARPLIIEHLINTARSFIFHTALPPALLAATIDSVSRATDDAAGRARLASNARLLRAVLREAGWHGLGDHHIIPCIVGSNRATLAAAAQFRAHRVHCTAIRPPTVPAGQSRLRFTVQAVHKKPDLTALAPDCEQIQQNFFKQSDNAYQQHC